MKVGDLVKSTLLDDGNYNTGIIVALDDRHRQSRVDVLFTDGDGGEELLEKVWVNHLEVISESW